MESKNSLFSFAKAKGNLVAVALAAVLMAANTTVALARNKATASNGTEKTVIGGVEDLAGIDPSSANCTDTKVGTNQTDGNKIVCFYNVGAKKFLSVGGLWGTQASLDVSPHSIYMYWNNSSQTYFIQVRWQVLQQAHIWVLPGINSFNEMGYLWTEDQLTGRIASSPLKK